MYPKKIAIKLTSLKSIYIVKQILDLLNLKKKIRFEHRVLQSKMELKKIGRYYLKMQTILINKSNS
jgi:hypothetical protein